MEARLLPALIKLGFWGVGLVALLDSSTIPVPMDAILAVYVWNNKPNFWLYCLMAALGPQSEAWFPMESAGPAANSSC